jgi:hypothetical protein
MQGNVSDVTDFRAPHLVHTSIVTLALVGELTGLDLPLERRSCRPRASTPATIVAILDQNDFAVIVVNINVLFLRSSSAVYT